MANRKEEYDSSRNGVDNEKANRPLLDQSNSPQGISANESKAKQTDDSGLNDTSVIIRDFSSPDGVVQDRSAKLSY